MLGVDSFKGLRPSLPLSSNAMEYLSSFTSFGHDDAETQYRNIYHTEEIHPHHKSSFTHEGIHCSLE